MARVGWWWIVVGASGCLVPDAMVDAYLDRDADGERTTIAGGTDCADDDDTRGARKPEVCGNGLDDDCDGIVDEDGIGALTFYADGDGDGAGDADAPVLACTQPEGAVPEPNDCDDDDKGVYPGAEEDCGNGIDDDCDGRIDESDEPPIRYPDVDRDGYGDPEGAPIASCRELDGYASNAADCDDADPKAHPNAPEVAYNGQDEACDGLEDEFDRDGDGYRVDPDHASTPVTAASYVPARGEQLDCDDLDASIHPGVEDRPYDGVDSDCDGADDYDADGDGYRALDYGGGDCDDGNPEVNPGAAEVYYDDVDDDCDPRNDADADLDGVFAMQVGGTDCDDNDPDNWLHCADCVDRDADGAFVGCDAYVVRTADCDDAEPRAWTSCLTCEDTDGDRWLSGCDAYPFTGEDCAPDDPDLWARCSTCEDADGDGYRVGCDAYLVTPRDCDDTVANAWEACGGCVDADGDGWGIGVCDGPPDCDDTDPDVFVSCDTCVDDDGDGARTGCDQYVARPYDCADDDPDIGGHRFEELDDGIDQDCTGDDLTVSERDGLFVSEAGVDRAGCGTMAEPCRQIGYAAREAEERGKLAVFVAEGVYEGFETAVSVFGGLSQPGWFPSTSQSTVSSAYDPVVAMRGANNQIVGVAVSMPSSESRVTGVIASAAASRLSNVSVTAGSAVTNCVGVAFSGVWLLVDGSAVRVCGGGQSLVGIQSVGTSVEGEIKIVDSLVEVIGDSAAASAAGIVSKGASVETNAVRVVVGPSFASSGLFHRAASPVSVTDTSIRVHAASNSSSNGITSYLSPDVQVSRTLIDLGIGETVSGVVVLGEDVRLQVDRVAIMGEGDESAAGIDVGASAGTAFVSFISIDIRGDGVGVSSTGSTGLSIANAAVAADRAAVRSDESATVLGLYADAPCVLEGGQRICQSVSVDGRVECNAPGCPNTQKVRSGPLAWGGLDHPLLPRSDSPLVDEAEPLPAGWPSISETDALRMPASVGGGSDIGAFEVQL